MSFAGGNADGDEDAVSGARLIPRITIQAFCEKSQTAELVETALDDRRMAKVALTMQNGGVEGAIETYRSNPTPNLIIVEVSLAPDEIPGALTRLAEVCDAGTRLIVLGHVNDVVLYRDLIRFGVSEYLVLPVSAANLVSAITEIFAAENSAPIGRSVGFVSAKGGAGASTIAHNIAWSIAQKIQQDVLILDMDLPFGTAGLNFNQDPPHGLGDAVFASEKMDATMLDRLMSKAAERVNLLSAPANLDRVFDPGEEDFEQVIELAQKSVPAVILDIPHAWNGWVKRTLASVDEIVIVAEPDLANLRNAKNLADALRGMRPADALPSLVVNQIGMPKRPEISAEEFSTSIDCPLIGEIPFDAALFGTAANNGQMLAEVSSGHRVIEIFNSIALRVTGRSAPVAAARSSGLKIPGLGKILRRA